MATINELRDLTFYIIRKLNDLIINLTTPEPPPPPRREIPNLFPNLTLDERIERLRRSFNNPSPPPSPAPITTEERIPDEEHEDIRRRIQELRTRLNTPPPPTPTITEERIPDERDKDIRRRIEDIRRRLHNIPPPPPPPPTPHQKIIKKFIKQDEERIMDLQKQAHEKRIILNYLLDELIQRRERKEDANVIKLLEEEFERLRLERERLEKRIIELKEHIRFMQE